MRLEQVELFFMDILKLMLYHNQTKTRKNLMMACKHLMVTLISGCFKLRASVVLS